MGKTKTKIIDDSKPVEEVKKPQVKDAKKPKDALAASLLEELNKEFGEVEKKPEKEKSPKGEEESKKIEKKSVQVEEKKAEKETPKPGKVKPRSKKYKEIASLIDPNQKYKLLEAIELAKKTAYSKFPGTMEAHINTHFKNIRGLVSLPFASGKKLTILAFPPSSKTSEGQVEELEEMGVMVGTDEKIAELEKGKGINFDVLVTTPEWMSKLAKVARVLGPKGLMPNPKNGTISDDLKKTVAELQGGKVEYKTEANNQVIHLGVGKVNQPAEEIAANIKILFSIIGKSKIKKITLSPTMGAGVKVDLASI
ncbi:hypothetical protein HY025_04070 [Candidatus Daviesbacteria bacterium]|nr:hypothetical protein [Candidatus Daviesbacteria bacterium]